MDRLEQAHALLQELLVDRPLLSPREESTLLAQVTAPPATEALARLEAAMTPEEWSHRLRVRLLNLLEHRSMSPLQYQELRQRLLYRAFQYLRDWNLAEEYVQDTLENMIRKHQQFRGDSSYSTWAHKILFYRFLSSRSRVKLSLADLPLEEAGGETTDSLLHFLRAQHDQSASDEEILATREKLSKVWNLAEVILTDRYSFPALNLLFLQGRSYEETARVLGIRLEHLHKVVCTARHKLRHSSRIRAIMEDDYE